MEIRTGKEKSKVVTGFRGYIERFLRFHGYRGEL